MVELQRDAVMLILAIGSSIFGAGLSYGRTKAYVATKSLEHERNITRIETTVNTLMGKVVYTDSCNQCEKRWAEKNVDMKDSLKELNTDIKDVKDKIEQVLIMLVQKGGV